MNELISMQKRDGSKGKLRIIKWITSHEPTQCDDFAHKLLVDKLSVKELRKKHQGEYEFVQAVLKRWIRMMMMKMRNQWSRSAPGKHSSAVVKKLISTETL